MNNVEYFGYSWLWGDDTTDECLEDCKKPTPPDECTDEEKQAVREECEALIEREGPLEVCLGALPESMVNQTYKNCMFDGCHAPVNITAIVCGDARALVEECERQTGTSIEWRSSDFCREFLLKLNRSTLFPSMYRTIWEEPSLIMDFFLFLSSALPTPQSIHHMHG